MHNRQEFRVVTEFLKFVNKGKVIMRNYSKIYCTNSSPKHL